MNRFFRGWKGVVATAAIAIVLLGAFTLVLIGRSILQARSTSPWARRYAAALPLPAARVDGETLLYRDVLERWDVVDRFAAREASSGEAVASVDELRAEAYEQAIRELSVRVRAEREGFALPEAAIQQNLDRLIALSGTSTDPGQIEQFLQTAFGWTLDEYRDRVIRPATLEEALVKRAEVGGQSPDDWRAAFERELRSEKVKRYLEFVPQG